MLQSLQHCQQIALAALTIEGYILCSKVCCRQLVYHLTLVSVSYCQEQRRLPDGG